MKADSLENFQNVWFPNSIQTNLKTLKRDKFPALETEPQKVKDGTFPWRSAKVKVQE